MHPQLEHIFSLVVTKQFQDFRVISYFGECLPVCYLLLLVQILHTLNNLMLRQQPTLFSSITRMLHQNILDDIALVKIL